MSESHAQQPPAWSPQPYAKPAPANDDLPVNSLRGTAAADSQEISNTSTTAVARWRKIEQAAEPRARSYNNAFAPANPARESVSAVHESAPANAVVTEQSAAPVVKRNAVTPARKVVESQPEVAEESNEIRLVSAVSVRDSHEPRQIARTSQSSGQSSRRSSSVAAASYQDVSEPPSLNLAPALPNSSSQPPVLPPPPRSVDEPDLLPKLPRNQNQDRDLQSPSDRQPSVRPAAPSQSGSAYVRPQSNSTADCDALRESIQNLDITKIRVDTSPSFVEGYRSNQEKSSKEAFVQEAEDRAWYNSEGVEIARGRLVDMGYGAVVIQTRDGSQVTYLLNRLSEADHAYVSDAWGIPVTCSLNDGSFDGRNFIASTMTWKASGACHKPLYFEEVQLERYGHEWGPVVQPALSSLNFVKNVVFLPYKMGIHPMNECQYSLGYYRPGSCAPWTVGPVPISLRGAAAQAAVVGGAAWALP